MLALLGLGLTGPPATATQASVQGVKLKVSAAPGERNQIYLNLSQFTEGFYWAIEDHGDAALSAGPGCEPWGDGVVRCYYAGIHAIRVSAGGRNDYIDFSSEAWIAQARLGGGSGDDQIGLTDGCCDWPGEMRVRAAGGPGADVLYSGGKHLTATLAGGPGPDWLRGHKAPRAASREILVGGKGRDNFNAGQGRDTVRARDGDRDQYIACGQGRDTLARDPADPRAKQCERRR